MGVDNITEPNWINIVIDDNPQYLKAMREQAKDDGQEEKKLSLAIDGHSLNTDEFYFDEKENEIYYSGEMRSTHGTAYVSFSIPLSDTVLIDIIAHSIKRLNKLKTALESLR